MMSAAHIDPEEYWMTDADAKQAAFAPGIEDSKEMGDPSMLAPGSLVPYVVQEHMAQRAGRHYDVRAGKDKMLSWATRKELPRPGGKGIALFPQPVHCFPPTTPIITKDGVLSIGDIVEKRNCVSVLSMTTTGKLIYQPITNFWKRRRTERLIGLRVAVPFSRQAFICCTPGHRIYTPHGKVQAGDICKDDAILCRLLTPNSMQQQILLGCLMGDGSIDKRGAFRFGHTTPQREYFEFQYATLAPFFTRAITHAEHRKGTYGVANDYLSAQSIEHPLFKSWRAEYYPNGTKCVTREWLAKLSPLAIAIWYQDDGSILKSGSRFIGCSFSTHGFTCAGVQLIIDWFKQTYAIDSFMVIRNKKKQQYELRVNPKSALKLFELVTPYIHPSMAYKVTLPGTWHQSECYQCGRTVRAHVKYCSSCIRDDICKYARYIDFRRAYLAGLTLTSPKLLYNRFGTWEAARHCQHNDMDVFDACPQFNCGVALTIDASAYYQVWPVPVLKTYQHCRRHKYVYNIEVAHTHNYILGNGVVVGNSEAYSHFQGTLKTRYGAGVVRQADFGKVLITQSTPEKIQFVVAHKQGQEEFTLVRMAGKEGKKPAWLMLNTTPTEGPKYQKEHYKLIPAEQIDKLFDPQYVMSAKIDGAAALLKTMKDKVDVLSIRPSKKTGGPIIHTHRMGLSGQRYTIPKELQNTLLRGEIYGTRDGEQAIPAQELGGILNSTLDKSLTSQKQKGVKLRMALFGMPSATGITHADTRKAVQNALKFLPKDVFTEPPYAYTPEEKQKLWTAIRDGKFPLTREGVVGFPTKGGMPVKVKPVQDYDVHIREIFPGEGKYKGKAAGGFRYSHEPEGEIAGEVGTGISDEERTNMLQHPEEYVGRIARVTAQEKFPSGALRAPAYISRHEDYLSKESASAPVSPVALPVAMSKQEKRKKALALAGILTAAAGGTLGAAYLLDQLARNKGLKNWGKSISSTVDVPTSTTDLRGTLSWFGDQPYDAAALLGGGVGLASGLGAAGLLHARRRSINKKMWDKLSPQVKKELEASQRTRTLQRYVLGGLAGAGLGYGGIKGLRNLMGRFVTNVIIPKQYTGALGSPGWGAASYEWAKEHPKEVVKAMWKDKPIDPAVVVPYLDRVKQKDSIPQQIIPSDIEEAREFIKLRRPLMRSFFGMKQDADGSEYYTVDPTNAHRLLVKTDSPKVRSDIIYNIASDPDLQKYWKVGRMPTHEEMERSHAVPVHYLFGGYRPEVTDNTFRVVDRWDFDRKPEIYSNERGLTNPLNIGRDIMSFFGRPTTQVLELPRQELESVEELGKFGPSVDSPSTNGLDKNSAFEKASDWFVARIGDKRVGSLQSIPCRGSTDHSVELTDMIVDPHYRNRGVATQLLKAAMTAHAGQEIVIKPNPFGDKPLSRLKLASLYTRIGFIPQSEYKLVYMRKHAFLTGLDAAYVKESGAPIMTTPKEVLPPAGEFAAKQTLPPINVVPKEILPPVQEQPKIVPVPENPAPIARLKVIPKPAPKVPSTYTPGQLRRAIIPAETNVTHVGAAFSSTGAMGKSQTQPETLVDFRTRYNGLFTPEETTLIDRMAADKAKFETMRQLKGKSGYDVNYGPGGKGSVLHTPEEQMLHDQITEKLIGKMWEESKGDLSTFLKRYRGIDPKKDPRWLNIVMAELEKQRAAQGVR